MYRPLLKLKFSNVQQYSKSVSYRDMNCRFSSQKQARRAATNSIHAKNKTYKHSCLSKNTHYLARLAATAKHVFLFYSFIFICAKGYGDGAGNTVENSSVFSLIRML